MTETSLQVIYVKSRLFMFFVHYHKNKAERRRRRNNSSVYISSTVPIKNCPKELLYIVGMIRPHGEGMKKAQVVGMHHP
jgi:hypothetical protein